MIEVFAPATGEKLGEVPTCGEEEVRAAVGRARAAQEDWAARPPAERGKLFKKMRTVFFEHREEVATRVARENGKSRAEALLHDTAPITLSMTWLAARGPKLLAPEAPTGLAPFPRATKVLKKPHGVVGVLSPWNFPVTLPFTCTLEALFAGNGVVLKPSEHTPLVAAYVRELFVEAGLPEGLLQIVTGGRDTGAALLDGGVDFVHFTGSIGAGRKVAAACGERLIPCTMELGGKAPGLVLPDADLERTANALVYGAFANTGQICISIERILVPETMHDELMERVVAGVKALRQGDPIQEDVDVGAMTMPGQMEIVERLLDDAKERGARVLCGGHRLPGPGRFFAPTVVTDVTRDMPIAREEIFGPLVGVMRYGDLEEAVDICNSLPVGLAGYVFGKDRARAREVAARLNLGSVSVNDVFTAFATPEVPFGGVGHSGWGRTHGAEGLLGMTRSVTVADDRGAYAPERDLFWFPDTYEAAEKIMRLVKKTLGVFDVTSKR